jgi:hypothetical protein
LTAKKGVWRYEKRIKLLRNGTEGRIYFGGRASAEED